MKDTFSAGEIPDQFLQDWENLRSRCETASARESTEWEKAKGVWEPGAVSAWASYEAYAKARGALLQTLTDATMPSFHQARQFSSTWGIKSGKPADEPPKYPVFVPDEVMEEIDRIYIKHYRTTEVVEGPINQLLCFSCHHCSHETSEEDGTPVCKSTLVNYLTDVRSYLQGPHDFQDLKEDHPQRIGVANAAIRLEPFNFPLGVPGRLTLPLPTRGMLEDVWDLIMSTNQDLLREVCCTRLSLLYMPLNRGS